MSTCDCLSSSALHRHDPLFPHGGAAQYIGVAPQTLAVWKMTGKYGLPVIMVGRLCKYRKSDLDKWLASPPSAPLPSRKADADAA